jgi:hypothetical protein
LTDEDDDLQLALTTAEAIARDPGARAQDRVAASRLVAQLRGQLTERNRPTGGVGVVQVSIGPEFCPSCGARNPVFDAAEERIEEATERQRGLNT